MPHKLVIRCQQETASSTAARTSNLANHVPFNYAYRNICTCRNFYTHASTLLFNQYKLIKCKTRHLEVQCDPLIMELKFPFHKIVCKFLCQLHQASVNTTDASFWSTVRCLCNICILLVAAKYFSEVLWLVLIYLPCLKLNCALQYFTSSHVWRKITSSLKYRFSAEPEVFCGTEGCVALCFPWLLQGTRRHIDLTSSFAFPKLASSWPDLYKFGVSPSTAFQRDLFILTLDSSASNKNMSQNSSYANRLHHTNLIKYKQNFIFILGENIP
jgi:hypothetical protein